MEKTTKIGNTGSVRLSTKGIESLLQESQKRFIVHVGILGSKGSSPRQETVEDEKGGHKAGKKASPSSNADIGLAHEKGVKSKNLPRRSWLVEPLTDFLPEYFNKLGAEVIQNAVTNQVESSYVELGEVCEQIIFKGFETGGYGKWKALKASTIRAKRSSAILIDTAQLKKSVTSTVLTE